MKLCLRGVLAASLLCLVGTQQNNTICKPAFSCKALEDCPNALKELKEGKNLITCGLEGTTPQFCCKPSVDEKSKESSICQQRGPDFTCIPLRQCVITVEELRNGEKPLICSSEGSKSKVCCRNSVGAKSKEMCKKYADAVFVRIPDPYAEGFIGYETCALIEPLIVNGINAEPMEYPHMASIGFGNKDEINWLCGGSLISERYVLSVAHCSDGGRYGPAKWVRLGDYNIESTEDENLGVSEVEIYGIIARIPHPEYNTEDVYNDIALYKLDKNVIFSPYIRPICLQTNFMFPKTYAMATGWGRIEWGGRVSQILQKVNLTFSPRRTCRDAYKYTGKRLKNGINDETMLCAGDVTFGKDTCQGDTGGPLQIRLIEPYCMYSLVGISSFGHKCGGPDPSVFTRVSPFVPWIESIVWP